MGWKRSLTAVARKRSCPLFPNEAGRSCNLKPLPLCVLPVGTIVLVATTIGHAPCSEEKQEAWWPADNLWRV